MEIRKVFATTSALGLMAWGAAMAQTQGPNSSQFPDANQEPSTAVSSTQNSRHNRAEKAKRWTGSLVDAGCMAKASAGAAATMDEQGTRAATAQDTPSAQAEPPLAPDQGPETSTRGAATAPGGINHAPVQNPDHNPDMAQTEPMGQGVSARAGRENRTRDEARKCAATSATTSFGLVLGSGELVKFDSDGNSKASDEMKEVAVPSGKAVKAKVTGTREGSDLVRVASVEIKGKHATTGMTGTPSGQ